jgi:hypothetical protein
MREMETFGFTERYPVIRSDIYFFYYFGCSMPVGRSKALTRIVFASLGLGSSIHHYACFHANHFTFIALVAASHSLALLTIVFS